MFPDPLHRSAKLYPTKAAVVCGADRLSYRDVDTRANRLANALQGLGLSPGDRVALLLGNSTAYWEIYFGVARAGLCCVPVNGHLSAAEIGFILADCDASALIHDDAHAAVAAETGPPADGSVLHRIRLGGGMAAVGGEHGYARLLESASLRAPDDLVPEGGDALIVYTSGTTGRPKGVVLSHRSVFANGLSQVLAHGQRPDDRFITATPLYHLAGAARVHAVAIAGGTHLVMEKFEPDRFLRYAADERATSALLVATMARRLVDALGDGAYDLGSWRTVCHGAAPTSFDVLSRLCELMPVGHYVGWGLTEGGTFLTVLSPDDYRTADGAVSGRLESVGRDAVNAQSILVDDEGTPITESGHRGQLAVRSDRMMSRYWNQPDATAQVLRDGWLFTDDIAYRDDDGFLYVVDRRTDMIISGGVNIYPREIEDALEAHSAVLETAVIGVPDATWGEAPLALVVKRSTGSVTEDELEAHARTLLASFKMPREIVFVDDLPRNSVGKITKQELRKQYWQGFDKHVN